MHAGAAVWLKSNLGTPDRVLEFGSLNINGSARTFAPSAFWWGLDLQPGAGVNELADCASWWPERSFVADTVVCSEVLEHTPRVVEIVGNAFHHLMPGGRFLMTCASVNREPHSAVDGGPLRDGEYYENVTVDDCRAMFVAAGFVVSDLEYHADRGDLYVLGVKPA